MVSNKRRLVKETVSWIFEENVDTRIELHKASRNFIIKKGGNEDELVSRALEELGCLENEFYMKTSKTHHEEIVCYLDDQKQKGVIPRYDFLGEKKDQLVRNDRLREGQEREYYRLMFLNQRSIQEYLLEGQSNTDKDSNFERLCAIFIREYYRCEKVGILRSKPAADGGLDCFGVYDPYKDAGKSDFLFVDAKRRKYTDSSVVNDFIHKFEKGFKVMVSGREEVIPGYALSPGKPIQKALLNHFPKLSHYRLKPMMICLGKLVETGGKQLKEKYDGLVISGLNFIQKLCISISENDPEGYLSWFDSGESERFNPEAFVQWLDDRQKSLIIVNEKYRDHEPKKAAIPVGVK